jgi:histidyl-tRNA synthetase
MRDFLPDELRRREYVVGVIRDVYERYGFEPLETPAVENIETLLGKYGEESNKLIFKILKRGEHEATGEADLALRYDLTVPLARVVAQYQEKLPKFFKRYQIQPVWRADRPARGRFREFYQCDVDIVGSTSLVVEAELIAAVSEVLGRLGFDDFVVRVNHRRVLGALLEQAGIAAEKHNDALIAIDKLDKIDREQVRKELEERGISTQAAVACLKFFASNEGGLAARTSTAHASSLNDQRLSDLNAFLTGHPAAPAVAELATIIDLSSQTCARGRVIVDASLARGLSYYTGAIMEIAVHDLAGSLGGGGRYDNLIGTFLGRDIPSCGFSLGLERILVVMGERKMFPISVVRGSADVMVTIWSEGLKADALGLAAELRAAGIRVDVYPEAGKIPAQFKYASSRSYPFVVVVGEDEQRSGTVTVRDMRQRSQQSIPRAAVGEFLGGRIRDLPSTPD